MLYSSYMFITITFFNVLAQSNSFGINVYEQIILSFSVIVQKIITTILFRRLTVIEITTAVVRTGVDIHIVTLNIKMAM